MKMSDQGSTRCLYEYILLRFNFVITHSKLNLLEYSSLFPIIIGFQIKKAVSCLNFIHLNKVLAVAAAVTFVEIKINYNSYLLQFLCWLLVNINILVKFLYNLY